MSVGTGVGGEPSRRPAGDATVVSTGASTATFLTCLRTAFTELPPESV